MDISPGKSPLQVGWNLYPVYHNGLTLRDAYERYKPVIKQQQGSKGKYQLVVAKESWGQLKRKLKDATRKTTPKSFGQRVQEIKQIHRGWINNFRLANITGKLAELDGWLRNRLRYCIWHHWYRAERDNEHK